MFCGLSSRPSTPNRFESYGSALPPPDNVKVIGRYVLIGRHMSVAIYDAPDETSLLKITGPFSSYGVAHVAPAMPLDEANQVTW